MFSGLVTYFKVGVAAVLLSFPVLFSSCTKLADEATGEEIVLGCDGDLDLSMSAETKATAVTSIASSTVYWGATTGGNAAGSSNETAKWSASSVTATSASKINTGKYQTLSPTSYNYYVANASFTIGASTTMTVANNNTDIIAGRLYGSNSTTPTVTLDHIFARLCNVTTQAASGYTVSSISVSITPNTGGTYNMRTKTWSSPTAGSATGIANSSVGTKANDIYLVPGSYTITVGWTASMGNYTKTFSGVTKSVSLTGGKQNNLTVTLGGDATAVTFTTSVTAFTDVSGGTLYMN